MVLSIIIISGIVFEHINHRSLEVESVFLLFFIWLSLKTCPAKIDTPLLNAAEIGEEIQIF